MFTKLKQRSWIKIEVARCRSIQGCFQGLREACRDAALPYRTVAWWVIAFREGMDAVQDDPTWRTISSTVASLLDADRRWNARELAAEDGICHKTVLHILHEILGYSTLAARWIPHEISEVQQWRRYAVAQALLDRYLKDDFLGRIVAMDETWARSYEPNLKCQSNEWKHPSSPCPKKVRPTQCAVKVMFIVAYDNDGVNAASSCSITFVQRSGENGDTRWNRTPSFFMTMQGVTPLLLSRTSWAAENGRFCNIHRTHPILVHAISISSRKWKYHCEGPGTT